MVPAFETICEWFELTDGAVTLREIQDHSRSMARDDHTCSFVWLKQKLMDK